MFSPQDPAWIDRLGTGVAAGWEAKDLGGYRWTDPLCAWSTGWRVDLDGAAFPWGFGEVRVAPQLGPLPGARGRLAHPRGWVEVDFAAAPGGRAAGEITLPAGVRGTFLACPGSDPIPLRSGCQTAG